MVDLIVRLRRTPVRAWPTLSLSVAEAAALYIISFLTSALLGLVRQILLNARFGLEPEIAAYYAAARLPETLTVLIASGTLTNALIPVLLRVTDRDGEAAAHRLLNSVVTFLLVVVGPCCLLLAIGAPLFVRTLLIPGFDGALQELTAQLSRIMLIEVVLLVVEAGLIALLISRNQVLLPAIAIALRNVTVIGGIGMAYLVPSIGIYGPTIGSILDVILQIAILVPGLRRRGFVPRFIWNPGDRDLRTVGRLLVPNGVSGVANYGAAIVDTAYISLTGMTAAVGALANATLLVGLPTRLLGSAVGQAVLPHLADLSNRGEWQLIRQRIGRLLLLTGGAALLVALLMASLSRPMISLFFERGAFDRAAVQVTAQFLAIYALGLPIYVLTDLATRALVACYDTLSVMLTNIAQLLLRILLLTFTIGPYGPIAVPIAHLLSSALETLILLLVLRMRTRP